MKSVEQQALVTEKAQQGFKDYPAFELVPPFEGGDIVSTVTVDEPDNERQYIAALYELFYRASSSALIGRRGRELVAG